MYKTGASYGLTVLLISGELWV